MKSISLKRLEELRDIIYRRTSELKVNSINQAEKFVNRCGFVFAFKAKNSELPCLRHAACGKRNPPMPVHSHHDPAVNLVWRAKEDLPVLKKIYYGKALKRTPTMISLDIFPMFYATKGYSREQDLFAPLSSGESSLSERRIMEILANSPPMPTKELKISSGHSSPDRRYQFDSAMGTLQEKLLVVKIAEEYDPFTFIWGRLDRWLVREVEQSRRYTPEEGRRLVLAKYFSTVVAATEREVGRLFGWRSDDITRAIRQLLDERIISDRISLEGNRQAWLIHSDYL